MEYLEGLKETGMSANESKVYYELLRRGPKTALQISKLLSMDRTLVYQILSNLIEKGFASYTFKNKKIFSATEPKNLLNPIKKKEAIITDLIVSLNKIRPIEDNFQQIDVYEGKEGLRNYMRMLLNSKKVVSFGATGRAYDAIYELQRESKKIKFKARFITTTKYKTHDISKLKNVEIRYLDIKSEATTTIFDDSVGIHLIYDKPLIIVIKNDLIAQSYKNHFEVLWKSAKIL